MLCISLQRRDIFLKHAQLQDRTGCGVSQNEAFVLRMAGEFSHDVLHCRSLQGQARAKKGKRCSVAAKTVYSLEESVASSHPPFFTISIFQFQADFAFLNFRNLIRRSATPSVRRTRVLKAGGGWWVETFHMNLLGRIRIWRIASTFVISACWNVYDWMSRNISVESECRSVKIRSDG